ncbi:MAG: restriction endonuclease subunit S [Veillonellaceae bacterium]|nr:restriction endonuclease subunit S [Veillonellaceae bacterium]
MYTVAWKSLGEIAEIGTGTSNANEQTDCGEYPFYVRSKSIKRSNQFQFDETAIVIPGEGGIGDVFHYVEGKYALHQRAYRICLKDTSVTTKFVYYYMWSNFKNYISKYAVSATVSSIRKPMIAKYQVPIPPQAVQERVVSILDTLDALVNDISQGLPKEIKLRQKQYEYYRDRLLAFPREGEQPGRSAEDGGCKVSV